MKRREPSPEQASFYFRRTSTGVRVWKETWFGDQFEVLSHDEFAQLEKLFERFSIPLIEAED